MEGGGRLRVAEQKEGGGGGVGGGGGETFFSFSFYSLVQFAALPKSVVSWLMGKREFQAQRERVTHFQPFPPRTLPAVL